MDFEYPPHILQVQQEPATIARATNVYTKQILTGRAFAMLVAERLEQVDEHGYDQDHDLGHDQAELALAAKAYLDTYIDLALRPDLARKPGDLPESWPWQHDFWKEPTPADQAKALAKAIALAWAELDRILAAQALIDAARPLFNPE